MYSRNVKIQLLGPVRVETDEGEAVPIGGPKQRTVLARLAVEPGRAVSLDQLSEAVWGQTTPERAHRSLATYVSNLRREAHLPIEGHSGSYTLDVDRSWVDLCVFEDAVAAADQSAADPGSRSAGLRNALGLFHGTPFADVNQHGSFTAETVGLADMQLSALERAIEAELEAGHHDQAVTELAALIEENPDREHLRGLHMRALYAAGRQKSALESYQSYRTHLQNDLGLDPSPTLRDLELAILNHDESLSPSSAEVVDAAAESVRGVSTLPARYSSFVGRQQEIAQVRESLADRRLVTIQGPGGIGKSSLAIEAVRDAKLPEGCDISRLAIEPLDAGTVGSALAVAMGLQPASGLDSVALVTRYMGDMPHLLILDGCEAHIGEIATIVDRVLIEAPASQVLATSREPLMLAGERVVRVGGLPIEDAVSLFADRADLPTPLPEDLVDSVTSVCEALDGMALALELAAARARSIPLDQLEQRVDSQMPLLRRTTSTAGRHDSMARAIQWSSDLLTESEQSAYEWLSVFRRGFRLRDAVGLLDSGEAEDLVARLVDVSLLLPPDANGEYRYLEPIRQHAVNALEESGAEGKAHLAHAEWMVAEANRAFSDEWSPRRRAMRSWLFRRRGEFLDAVRWASEHGKPDLAIAIFAAIGKIVWSFEDIGHILQPMFHAFNDPKATPSPNLAIALADAAYSLKAYDRPDDARAFVERAEAIVASFDDESPEALRAKGTVLARRSIMDCPDIVSDRDVELAAQAIGLLERAGSPNAGAFNVNRGHLLFRLGRIDEATQAHAVANAWYLTTTGRPSPHSLNHLALVGAEQDADFDGAQAKIGEAVQIQLDEYDNIGAIGTFYLMAYTAMIGGQPVANAVTRMMDIVRISGGTYPFILEMWNFSEAGDSDAVMRIAKRWLGIRTWHRVDNEEYINDDPELTIYGDERTYPRYVPVLLPIARALEAAGHTEDAAYFAREIPTIVEDARITHWRFDLLALWVDLRRRLEVGEPKGVPLPELFGRLEEVIENYQLRSPDVEGWHGADLDPIDRVGAPMTFTRIRHL